jgi:tetratricopeptide (TPR) repeat protein
MVALVAAIGAVAAADPDGGRREAGDHARRGVALYKLGRYLEAIDEFEQAYVLYPSDALLYNLGQSHRQLDHCREALDYYQRFLDGSPDSALAPKVRELLPPLERACAVKYARPVDVTPAASINTINTGAAAAAADPAPAAQAASASAGAGDGAPDASTTSTGTIADGGAGALHVRGGLGVGVLASGGAIATPVGGAIDATASIGQVELGGRLGVGVFGGDPGETATAIELCALVGREVTRGELRFSAYGGAGALILSGLPAALGAGGRSVRETIAVPELAAIAAIDRDLDGPWTIGVEVELAAGASQALRGGASVEADLAVRVGYRR